MPLIDTTGIETDICRGTARRAYYNTSFSPEKRGDCVVDSYITTMRELATFIEDKATDEKQKEIAQGVFDKLREKYKAKTLTMLSAQSRCISTMITGAANFPVRRAEKANAAERKRSDEWLHLHKHLEQYALKSLQNVYTAQETQLSEIETLKRDIEKAESNQTVMKAVNAAIRKGDKDKAAAMLGVDELKADCFGNLGFARFQLSNNLANIKRMKQRLTLLERKAERAETVGQSEQQLNGLEVVFNYTEDRLQLIFEDVPSYNVRDVLKSNGFKWSPSFSAWQRKLTGNATYALKHLLHNNQHMMQYLNQAA